MVMLNRRIGFSRSHGATEMKDDITRTNHGETYPGLCVSVPL